jgi:hypothetical protein
MELKNEAGAENKPRGIAALTGLWLIEPGEGGRRTAVVDCLEFFGASQPQGFLIDEESLPKSWKLIEADAYYEIDDEDCLVRCPYCQAEHVLWGLLDLVKDGQLNTSDDEGFIGGPNVRQVVAQRLDWFRNRRDLKRPRIALSAGA